jgi:hypothetical protein
MFMGFPVLVVFVKACPEQSLGYLHEAPLQSGCCGIAQALARSSAAVPGNSG